MGSVASSLPVSSSKLKVVVGERKSSVLARGVAGAIGAMMSTDMEAALGAFRLVVDGLGLAGLIFGVVDLAADLTGFDLRVVGLDPLLEGLALIVDLGLRVVGLVVTGDALLVRLGLVVEREERRLVVITVFAEEDAFLARRTVRPSIDLFFSIVYNYSIMAVKITKKQLAVLNFLQDFTEENGYSPSYREIMAGLGLSSVSAVAEHVENLVEKGVLRKVPGAARSLEVLDYKHEETVGLFKARMLDCTEEEKRVLAAAAEILGLDLG